MLYDLKCQKQNCRCEFEVALPLEIYSKFLKTDPPLRDIKCPACWTKSPARHYKPGSAPAVHRDIGTWNPRTAPTALAGKHYHSKDEKNEQIQHVLGDNYRSKDVDRDLTVQSRGPGVKTTRANQSKAPSGKLSVKARVISAFAEAGKPMKLRAVADQTGVSYANVSGVVYRHDGFVKTAPGEFKYTAP